MLILHYIFTTKVYDILLLSYNYSINTGYIYIYNIFSPRAPKKQKIQSISGSTAGSKYKTTLTNTN